MCESTTLLLFPSPPLFIRSVVLHNFLILVSQHTLNSNFGTDYGGIHSNLISFCSKRFSQKTFRAQIKRKHLGKVKGPET